MPYALRVPTLGRWAAWCTDPHRLDESLLHSEQLSSRPSGGRCAPPSPTRRGGHCRARRLWKFAAGATHQPPPTPQVRNRARPCTSLSWRRAPSGGLPAPFPCSWHLGASLRNLRRGRGALPGSLVPVRLPARRRADHNALRPAPTTSEALRPAREAGGHQQRRGRPPPEPSRAPGANNRPAQTVREIAPKRERAAPKGGPLH